MIKKLLLFLLLPTTIVAQSNQSQLLDSVVVKSIRGVRKTPITQKTVNKEEIQKFYQGQEVPILLDRFPSITSQSDGGHSQGYTYFRIRGIDQTRINMTLNGVPLNEPEDQGVYTSNYPGFTNIIQSLQIQRGVGQSTNGAASFGGSINFISQNGQNKESEFLLGYGAFNTRRINFSNSTGQKNNFSLFTNFSAYRSDGYRYNSGGSGISFFGSGSWVKDKNLFKFTAFHGNSKNNMAWFGVTDSDIEIDRKTNYNQNDGPDNFSQSFAQFQWTRILGKYSKISNNFYYNYLNGSYDPFGPFVDSPQQIGIRRILLRSNFIGLISNYLYQRDKFNFTIGLNLNHYVRNHTGDSLEKFTLYQNSGVKSEASVFTKINYDIDKFTLFYDLQVRYTDFRYKGDRSMNLLNWTFINPKFGITYNKTKYLNYYVSVGKTSREPTRTNLFSGNDNLESLNMIQSESVVDWELGMNLKKSRLQLQANFFLMSFRNEILPTGPLGSNSLPLMVNVDRSFRTGLEVDFSQTTLFNFITTNTNLTIMNSRVTDSGKRFQPLLTPQLILNHSITFNFKGVSANINGRYQSKSFISFDNNFSIPDFFVLGANLSFEHKKTTAILQANNILSESYFTSGMIDGGVRYLFANPPINFNLTLKRKF